MLYMIIPPHKPVSVLEFVEVLFNLNWFGC